MAEDFEELRKALVGRMTALIDDPESYDAFMEELVGATELEDEKLAAFESRSKAALGKTLSQITLLQQRESQSHEMSAALRQFSSPVILVREDGRIVNCNDPASQYLNVEPGGTISALAYELEAAEPLLPLLRQIAQQRVGNTAMTLRRAIGPDGRPATLAISPRAVGASQDPGVLLFVIDPKISATTLSLMQQAYGLTDAETEILGAFSDGRTLQEIAADRQRSFQTVRTQFQALITKTSVGGQAELMRSAQAMAGFVNEAGRLEALTGNPNRKRLDVLRTGGRSVDVLLSGDLQGRPVIFMNGAFLRSFSPAIEKAFQDAGLCVVAVGRPGFGQSSPAPDGDDITNCVARDVRAVLNQLGVEKAPFLAHSTGVPVTLRAGPKLGRHIERLVIIGGMVPPAIMRAHAGGSLSMVSALLAAAGTSRTLLRLALSGRHRMYLRMGPARFLARQYRNCTSDSALAMQPDFIAEYDAAVTHLMAQGYGPGMEELIGTQTNWLPEAKAFGPPTTALHGLQDPLCPIAAMEAFCRAAGFGCVSLPDTGHLSLAAQPARVIAHLTGDE